jgi:outer membrane protein assembly factor BamB
MWGRLLGDGRAETFHLAVPRDPARPAEYCLVEADASGVREVSGAAPPAITAARGAPFGLTYPSTIDLGNGRVLREPTVVEANGRSELVTQATTFIRGYDPATGKELWKLSGNSEITIPTPVVAGGMAIVTNGYRGVQPIFAIKPGGTGDITLKEGQTKSDAIAWSTNRGGPYIPTPVAYGDLLYVLQNNGVLAAYKVASGERVYQERLGGTGGSFSASPIAADGKIYCSSEDGDVFVVKAGPAYQLLAQNAIGEVLMATPAVSDGLLIFRGSKNVYAIRAGAATK